MIALERARGAARGVAPWLGAVALGAALGAAIAALLYWGPGRELQAGLTALAAEFTRVVGPVWVPMAFVAGRVVQLSVHAALTRRGTGRLGEPVRPELGQLAPIFAALGLAGTVWGLTRAFTALGEGDFLSQLPLLLGGLGAAMTSTLVGLALQIATLLIAAFNPAFSQIDVGWSAEGAMFSLDRVGLGAGDAGMCRVADAVAQREPEALRVVFASRVPEREREALRSALWARLDAGVPVREAVA